MAFIFIIIFSIIPLEIQSYKVEECVEILEDIETKYPEKHRRDCVRIYK